MISAAESAGELLDVSEPAEQSPHDSQLDAWDAATGSFLTGFPQVMGSLQFFDQPIVADLTGSRGQAYAVEASSDADLRAFDADGREAPGFPKLTGGWVTGGAVFGSARVDGRPGAGGRDPGRASCSSGRPARRPADPAGRGPRSTRTCGTPTTTPAQPQVLRRASLPGRSEERRAAPHTARVNHDGRTLTRVGAPRSEIGTQSRAATTRHERRAVAALQDSAAVSNTAVSMTGQIPTCG